MHCLNIFFVLCAYVFHFRHSLRLNTQLTARACVILGSLTVGVTIILQYVIHDLYAAFHITYKKNQDFFQNHYFHLF